MSGIYQFYLHTQHQQVDGVTQWVAKQVVWVLQMAGCVAEITPVASKSSLFLLYENVIVARIIEGCNGVAIAILFVSFVMAFKGKWRTMVLFVLAGITLIHLLNVLRICLLAYVLYTYPAYEHLVHGTIFPLIIYSVVFLLWVIWVTRFSYIANERS